jgi:hypothetical protein
MIQLLYQKKGESMPQHVLDYGEEKDLELLKEVKKELEIEENDYTFTVIDTENWNRKID